MPTGDRPRLRSRTRSAGAWCACAVWLAACATTQSNEATPEQAVIALSRALNEGKLDDAYALMSDDYRKRVSLEQWKKNLSENADEVIEVSGELARVRGRITEEAVLRYGERELRLQKQGDRWLVASDIASFYDQSTPRDALKSFIRALSRKRYDLLLRLCPNADKEGSTTESMEAAWSGRAGDDVERLLNNLRAHQDDPIEIAGDRATLPYGDRMQVQMLREDGVWKIEDPE